MSRSVAPVFVVGCPRSGTTLLYHMLLSAGGFAYYRSETHVFNSLAPHCGDLTVRRNRERLLAIWIASDMHARSGLAAESVRDLVDRFSTAGGFLSAVMNLMVEAQGRPVVRWAETTPAHILHTAEIVEQIPGSLVVHVIRDGRDVAASLEKQQWIGPFPWDRQRPIVAAAAFWSWIVREGCARGLKLGAQYHEVRYESLVADPRATLASLSAFVGQDLSYDHVLANPVGSVARPNTSFPGQVQSFSGRWRDGMHPNAALLLNDLLAPRLGALGYVPDPVHDAGASRRLAPYFARFSLRQWSKEHTPLARRADISLFAPRTPRAADPAP